MSNVLESPAKPIYLEEISSPKTAFFFLILTLLLLFMAVVRWIVTGMDWLTALLCAFSAMFLFYVLNFQVLLIKITPGVLSLRFGIFAWTVPLNNIADCRIDDIPLLMRIGGAGIHFMFIRKRYRVSFNFLEYPRVVVSLKRKAGLVSDISFTTRQPGKVVKTILGIKSASG